MASPFSTAKPPAEAGERLAFDLRDASGGDFQHGGNRVLGHAIHQRQNDLLLLVGQRAEPLTASRVSSLPDSADFHPRPLPSYANGTPMWHLE